MTPSKSRNKAGSALMIRPTQRLLFEMGAVRVADCMNFLQLKGLPAFQFLVYSILFYGARFHIDQLPDVAIKVLEPMLVHKSMILGFIVGCSAGGHRLANQFIDFFPALPGQTHENFCAFRRVT